MHSDRQQARESASKSKAGGVKRTLEVPEVDRPQPINSNVTVIEPIPEEPAISRPRSNNVGVSTELLEVVPEPEVVVRAPKVFNEAHSCLGVVWERNGGCFAPVLDTSGEMTHAKCCLCGKQYVHSASSGTSNMNRHWIRSHNGKASLLHKSVLSSPLTPAHQWHNDRALATLIVLDGGPITRTRNPHFHWGMREIVGSWVVPSPGHLNSSHFDPMMERFHVSISPELVKSSHFTLCFDAWKAKKGVKSGRNRSFLGISVFAVDRNWKLSMFTVAVHRMMGVKDKDAIVDRIDRTLERLSLPKSKIVNCVTDNAATEVAAGTQLVEGAEIKHHSRCFNHTLSLALKDGFRSTVTETQPVETKFGPAMLAVVHDLVMLFADHGKLSDQLEMEQRLRKISNPLCLVADIETRWTSLYDMFYRVFRLATTIRRVLADAKLPRYQSKVDQAMLTFLKVQNDLPFIITVLWYCKTASDVMEEAGSFLSSLLYVVSDLERKLMVCGLSMLRRKALNLTMV